MDIVEFYKERKRMCDTFERCAVCPLKEMNCEIPSSNEEAEEMVEAVEKWSKEHPLVTNQMKFEETFGKIFPGMKWVHCSSKGVIALCDNFTDCKECVKWWNSEYKEKGEK